MKKNLQIYIENILKFYEDFFIHGYYHHGCYHL